MSVNALVWQKAGPGGQEWPGMTRNDQKWPEMTRNDQEWPQAVLPAEGEQTPPAPGLSLVSAGTGKHQNWILENTSIALFPWENACSSPAALRDTLMHRAVYWRLFLLSSLTHFSSLDPMQYPTVTKKLEKTESSPAEPAELWEFLKLT